MTLVAISQSNYLPWRGYFAQIAQADHFVFLDNVQFTKRDWRTRNRIKTPNGLSWLNVPIQKPEIGAIISQIVISDPNFRFHHLETIRRNYREAKHFEDYWSWFEGIFLTNKSESLSLFNIHWVQEISKLLGLSTQFHMASDFKTEIEPTHRLLSICQELRASEYLTGPSAQSYLRQSLFLEQGIEIKWMNYNFCKYTQLWGDFQPTVSIIDLIFNVGIDHLYLRADFDDER